MLDALIEFLGSYTPVTTSAQFMQVVDGEVSYYIDDVVASGFAGVDWPWIMSAVLLIVCIYCFFRLLGVILK